MLIFKETSACDFSCCDAFAREMDITWLNSVPRCLLEVGPRFCSTWAGAKSLADQVKSGSLGVCDGLWCPDTFSGVEESEQKTQKVIMEVINI